MLNRLVELSLRYKFLVLIIFAVVAFLGLSAVRSVPIDAFPDVTPAQVNIYTESPGLAAEDVEQLLTTPVESALAGLPKVQEIRSVSLFGLSFVSVYFEDDMDVYFARQLVGERLQEIGDRLPEGYGKPSMGPNTSGLGQVYWYTVERAPGVTKEQVTDMDLRTWQEWTVRLILRTAPGVDDVSSWGGGERQFQVQIDPRCTRNGNLRHLVGGSPMRVMKLSDPALGMTSGGGGALLDVVAERAQAGENAPPVALVGTHLQAVALGHRECDLQCVDGIQREP